MNLYPILYHWASTESLSLPLRPFSGITHIRDRWETRTSFSHTFRENPSTSGVTVLIFTIKVYKLHGLSETAGNGEYYYLWIVRDVKTRAVPFFMARSGVHVLVILAASMEELTGRVDEVVYLHDGASIYNALA